MKSFLFLIMLILAAIFLKRGITEALFDISIFKGFSYDFKNQHFSGFQSLIADIQKNQS